ncbi:MAG: branched-chain amino acid aminotransferase [Cytophagales bacterium]|nr:branched-chain amino acid aminotransferase [Cytophagales bacterium]
MTDVLEINITKTTDSKLPEVDMDNIAFGRAYSDHMFIADYEDGEWKNSRIIPYRNLSISPANAALHYAQSIFEGLKAYRTQDGDIATFRADENARRMRSSAIRMCMPAVPEELFLEAIYELVNLDRDWVPSTDGSSLYIRPFQFAMDPYIGIRPAQKYTFMVISGPVGQYYTEPVKVKIETEYARAMPGGVGAAKTAGNYAAALYPAKRAQDEGYHQLIWTDAHTHKYIEESGTMNIMFVIDGMLVTPQTSDTILAGITRASAIELAKDWGMIVEERRIKVTEIIEAMEQGRLQEAFGIGTAATVSQISVINHEGIDYELPSGESCEISNKLLKSLTDIRLGRVPDKFGWMHKI